MATDSDLTRIAFASPKTWFLQKTVAARGPSGRQAGDSSGGNSAVPPPLSAARTVFFTRPVRKRGPEKTVIQPASPEPPASPQRKPRPASPLPSGTQVGDIYEILKPIARGGMSFVYLVQHLKNGRLYALKEAFGHHSERLRIDEGANGETHRVEGWEQPFAENALLKEASVLAGMSMGQAPRLRRIFRHNGSIFFAMDYVEGEILSNLHGRVGGFSAKQVREIVDKVSDALDAVHSQGAIHGDVKPANVIVRPGKDVALIDFGSAHWLDEDAPELLSFTAGYAPPEKTEMGGDLGPWTDVYSLGVTTLSIMAGSAPAPRSNVLEPDLDELAVKATQRYPEFSGWMTALTKATHQSIENRTQSMSQLRNELGFDESTPSGIIAPTVSDDATFFISYSSQDRTVVDEYVGAIQRLGVNIWIDRSGIAPGSASWGKEIHRGMTNSKVVLLFLSQNSARSETVMDEIYLARSLGKQILLARLDGTPIPEELAIFLVRSQHFDAGGSEPKEFANQVATGVLAHL